MFLIYYLNQVYLNFVHDSDIYLLRALSTTLTLTSTLLMSQETYESWKKKTFQSEQPQTCT